LYPGPSAPARDRRWPCLQRHGTSGVRPSADRRPSAIGVGSIVQPCWCDEQPCQSFKSRCSLLFPFAHPQLASLRSQPNLSLPLRANSRADTASDYVLNLGALAARQRLQSPRSMHRRCCTRHPTLILTPSSHTSHGHAQHPPRLRPANYRAPARLVSMIDSGHTA
jgi:hypothetical protein